MKEEKRKKVVVIGGGTGTFSVLTGLKAYPVDITAIVTMADSGGSTGRLRDEFGVLPPGDIRQCLVALSEASEPTRRLFNYRFDRGALAGHSFGNLFISAIENMTGNFNEALTMIGEILKVRGKVLPVTLDKVHLIAELNNGKLLRGEDTITNYQMISRFGIRRIFYDRRARANPEARKAISEADLIIVGPGDFYTSLIPNFLVRGIPGALGRAKGVKVYVVNLMNKYGHTDDFTAQAYVKHCERFIGFPVFDAAVYNTEHPSRAMLSRYVDEGEPVFLNPDGKKKRHYRIVSAKLLRTIIPPVAKGDPLARTLIRHDPGKLSRVLMTFIQKK